MLLNYRIYRKGFDYELAKSAILIPHSINSLQRELIGTCLLGIDFNILFNQKW